MSYLLIHFCTTIIVADRLHLQDRCADMDIIHKLYIAIVREYASQVWVLYLLKDQQTLEKFACKVCLKQWNSNYPAMHLELLPHIGIKRNYLWRIYRGFWGLVVNRLSWLSGRALHGCTSQVSWVRFPATAGLFTFLYFHLKNLFTRYKQLSIPTCSDCNQLSTSVDCMNCQLLNLTTIAWTVNFWI